MKCKTCFDWLANEQLNHLYSACGVNESKQFLVVKLTDKILLVFETKQDQCFCVLFKQKNG